MAAEARGATIRVTRSDSSFSISGQCGLNSVLLPLRYTAATQELRQLPYDLALLGHSEAGLGGLVFVTGIFVD